MHQPTTPEPRSLQDLTTPPSGRWYLHGEPKKIERAFKFKDFDSAWAFMSAVVEQCKDTNHHPEWSNVYNEVFVRWTTHHNNKGVMKKDRIMATVCDELAQKYGAEAIEGSSLGSLAGGEQSVGRDCCNAGPKSEKEKIEKEEAEEGKQGSVAGIGGQPT